MTAPTPADATERASAGAPAAMAPGEARRIAEIVVDAVENIEAMRARTGTEHWLEQGWQRQRVLPVVVSTRDGHRFGFFPLAEGTAGA